MKVIYTLWILFTASDGTIIDAVPNEGQYYDDVGQQQCYMDGQAYVSQFKEAHPDTRAPSFMCFGQIPRGMKIKIRADLSV